MRTKNRFSCTSAPAVLITLVLCNRFAAADAQEQPSANAGGAAEPQQAEAQFDVWEYRVLGNTMLPAQSIESAVYPFLGPGKTLNDVESARQTLERIYRDAGYGTVFVDIPEQEAGQGIVRLQVTEGRLDRVRITGARYFSNGRIRASLPALASGSVLHLPQVQTELARLNRQTGDRVVVPVLKAGRTPGTVDMELKVDDKLPLHGSLELNDRYTANTSRLRVNASVSYNNLFQDQQILSLQYQTAPEEPSDVQAIVGSYVFRVPALPDTTFALYAVDSETDVAALGALSVIGNGQIFGARAIRSLPEQANYFHNVTFGLDYKDFLENIQLEEDALITPIRYMNWGVTYSGTLRGERTLSEFSLGGNFGIRSVVNEPAEFEDKRFKGAANYFYVRGSAQQLRQLPWDLQLFGQLTGQFTQDALVSNEQLALGGSDTVRGYLESSQLGDYGASGTLELRQAWLSKPLQLPPGAAYFFMFYDAGTVAIIDPLPSQTTRFELASAGLGVRVSGWHGVDLAFDWAHALMDAGTIERGDDRTHFSFRYAF